MIIETLKIDINGTIYDVIGTVGIGTNYVKHNLQNSKNRKIKQFSDVGLEDLFKKYNAKFVK
jgi:hypothetical protein